jgi:hypothetical protein
MLKLKLLPRLVLSAILVFLPLSLFTPVSAASVVYAGTGQAEGPAATLDKTSLATQAATEALQSFQSHGGTTAKLVLVMQNLGNDTSILNAIRAKFPKPIPIAGVYTSWDDYTPHTIKSIPPDKATSSIAIMVLGGDIAVQISQLQAGDISNATQATLITDGQNLARGLTPSSTQKNLVLLLGAMHTPHNESVVAGMQQVWGKPLPSNIKIMGWGAPDWGGPVYANDNLTSANQQVVMISGNFNWAFQGINHGVNGWGNTANDPVLGIATKIDALKQELGGNPDATFMVIGHPGRSNFVAIRDMLQQKLSPTSPLIGMHAGSETGHDLTTADVVAGASHFFVAGIKSNTGSSTSSAAVCATDLNSDGFMDLSDYGILAANFFKTNPTNPKADINKDGFVDLSDYGLLAAKFLTLCN